MILLDWNMQDWNGRRVMKSNERLIEALEEIIEINPDIEIGKYIRYVSSVSDLAYMTDDDIYRQIKNQIEIHDFYIKHQIDPNEYNYLDEAWWSICDENPEKKLYSFSKENEQIAYERYKKKVEDRIFFELEERIDACEFLKRFQLFYVEPEDFKGITVINHCYKFWNDFPLAYRHMNLYGVARKGDKYLAFHSYACKNPCFGELFASATTGIGIPVNGDSLHVTEVGGWNTFDEYFAVVIDWSESPRFTDYINHIQYGVLSRPGKKEIEVYDADQTIEIFHELMQKSNKITSTWEGVLYDDGSLVI